MDDVRLAFPGGPSRTQNLRQLEKRFESITSSPFVEVCLARAAKTTVVLTNSENAARDAEKAAKNGRGTGSGLARQPGRLATERRTETQVLPNIGATRGVLAVNQQPGKSV